MARPDAFDLEAERALYWRFHWGRPARQQLRARGPRGIPAGVAQLGTLVALELAGGAWVWPGQGTVHLATDRHGRSLFLCATAGVVADDKVRAGRIVAIRYRTNKGDGAAIWRHEFEGRRPLFTFDDDGHPVIRRAGSRFRVTWRGIVG